MSTTSVVSIGADLSQIRRDLALIPNMTGSAAQQSLIALERMVQQAEKAAKSSAAATAAATKAAAQASIKAAEAAEKASEEAAAANKEGAKGLAEFAGIDVGPIEKLGEALKLASSPMGALALSAAGAVIAVAAVGAAIYGIVNAAIEYEAVLKPLRKNGILPALDPKYAQDLQNVQYGFTGLSTRVQMLMVDLGGKLAPIVLKSIGVLSSMLDAIERSGGLFTAAGKALRDGLIWYVGLLVDGLLVIPRLVLGVGSIWGQVFGALGLTELAAGIEKITSRFTEMKDGIAPALVDAAAGFAAAGMGKFSLSADGAADSVIALGKSVETFVEPTATVKALTDVFKELQAAEDAAAAAGLSEDDKALILLDQRIEQVRALADLYPKNAEVQEAANKAATKAVEEYTLKINSLTAQRMEAAKKEAEAAKAATEARNKLINDTAVANAVYAKSVEDAVSSLESVGESLKAGLLSPLTAAQNAVKSLATGISSMAGIDLASLTDPMALIAMAADAVGGLQEAKAGVKDAKTALADAEAGGDPAAIEAAQAGLDEARAGLEAASPAVFIEELIGGASELVAGIVDALPKLLKSIIKQLPTLINAIIAAIPDIIMALVENIPAIAVRLAIAFAVELPLAIIGNLPGIVKALAKGIGKAFVEAGKTLFQVVKDVFREIGTAGRAKTETFGDTPGVVRATYAGLNARFAPGDLVVAARTMEGLRAQVQADQPTGGKASVTATLDLRDGGQVIVDRAMARNLRFGTARAGRR